MFIIVVIKILIEVVVEGGFSLGKLFDGCLIDCQSILFVARARFICSDGGKKVGILLIIVVIKMVDEVIA